MIEWIIDQSIRRRWTVVCAAVVIALAGWYAASHAPVDAIPDLSENQVILFTPWPGYAPQEIEDQITAPLSGQLRGIEGVATVRGNSELNFSAVTLVFDEAVSVAEARSRVQAKLSQVAGLPPGVRVQLAPEAPATGQILWYVLVAPQWDLARLRTLHDVEVRPQLATVSGVAEVASVGGFEWEYRISVDNTKLAEYGLSLPRLCAALESLDQTAGSRLLFAHGSEIVVRSEPVLKTSPESDPHDLLDTLQNAFISAEDGVVRLGDVARVARSPVPRRGAFEMDGVEVVGGVAMMRYGANPLEVTERLEARLEEIEAGLPHGVSIHTVYDRVRLVRSAISTVTTTMIEAMVTASLCVVLVLLHFRTSLVIVLTLPLTVLGSLLLLSGLQAAGVADARINIMSLAGLVISIGVLVDASVVIAENVVHRLRERFGDQPVRGDVRGLVAQACKAVGRPTFFAVLIMLLSFFPVFALYGIEGKMFRPLAITKSLALAASAVLAITVVPALCTFFVRGRLRKEDDSWIVRSALDVYRPVLRYLLDRPALLAWILGVTFLVGFAPLGSSLLSKAMLAIALAATGLLAMSWSGKTIAWVSLVIVALVAQEGIQPLAWERTVPLDEGTAMDMPITLPRISVSQAVDDLKMRDMVLCRFPEVEMAMGKAGRAETATDPAPIDMIETMVMFRPREFWPRRKLSENDMRRQAEAVFAELVAREIVAVDALSAAELSEIAAALGPQFDAHMREYCYHRNEQHLHETDLVLRSFLSRELLEMLDRSGLLIRESTPADVAKLAAALDHRHQGEHTLMPRDFRRAIRHAVSQAKALELIPPDADVAGAAASQAAAALNALRTIAGEPADTLLSRLTLELEREQQRLWQQYTLGLDRELVDRAAGTYTRLALEEILGRVPVANAQVQSHLDDLQNARLARPQTTSPASHHHAVAAPSVRRSALLDEVRSGLTQQFAASLLLQVSDRRTIGSFGGEMDQALKMPGWTNVWTRPIQNRVDMLSTGVNTDIGICVLGQTLDEVVAASEQIAQTVHRVSGAQQVVADPIRGKPYLNVELDVSRIQQLQIPLEHVQTTLQAALSGRVVAHALHGRQRHAVRVLLESGGVDQTEQLRSIALPGTRNEAGEPVTLGEVAQLKYEEGPTSIKSENGLLRNYVRFNVAGRDPLEFIDDAKQTIAEHVTLPEGVFLKWTGQFEQQAKTKQRLLLLLPIVVALILGLLIWTYHDVADALLVLLAIPGALAGGLFMQWLLGTQLSVTVLVGYIACFGMAASTGIIMLVYLREAVSRAGSLESITLEQLKTAVLNGAVQRLRPKLLTEATAIIAIAPMLWSSGTGSEVIRPMAAPVLGGILVADEVIDLFLPVAFYWVRRWRWHRVRRQQTPMPDSELHPSPSLAIAEGNLG